MYNYEYVKDENGKITNILVDDKPVMKSYMRGFRKAQTTDYFQLFNNDKTFSQPFSGELFTLTGLEASIYCFVKLWEQRFHIGGEEKAQTPIQTFDDMRYFFWSINPHLYMELLD
jgi:hypothetical protein